VASTFFIRAGFKTKKHGNRILPIAAPLLNNHTKQILEIHHRLEDELAFASAVWV